MVGSVIGGAVAGAAGAACGTCALGLRIGSASVGGALGGALNRAVAGTPQSMAAAQRDAVGATVGFVAGEAGGKVLNALAKGKLDALAMQAAVQRTEAAAQNLGHLPGTAATQAAEQLRSRLNALGAATGEGVGNVTTNVLPAPVESDQNRRPQ